MPTLTDLRTKFHTDLRANDLLGVRTTDGRPRTSEVEKQTFPVWSNADGHNPVSVVLCALVARAIEAEERESGAGGTTSGTSFERCVGDFVAESLALFAHLS